MENKKSKAFIITFVIILIFLVVGYYLYTNKEQLFGTKGDTSVSKIFSPLLGSSKNKDLNVIDTVPVETTPNGDQTGNNNNSNQNNQNNQNDQGNNSNNKLPLNPISLPSADNTITPTIENAPEIKEVTLVDNVTPPSKGICPSDQPLEFTDSEKKTLEELTRSFYLLAPTIKTQDDVDLSASEYVQQSEFVDQVKELTGQCYDQKGKLPSQEAVYGNPWFKPTERGTYTNYKDFELMLNIW